MEWGVFMAMAIECGKESKSLFSLYQLLKYRINFRKEHPDYFDSDGILVFVGPQGSGKTLSAVNYVDKLLQAYPKCKLVTNLNLKRYPVVSFEDYKEQSMDYIHELRLQGLKPDIVDSHLFKMYVKENSVFPFLNNDDLTKYSNGENGVIFFIDEIQLYLNSLESKNINMDTMTQISQQRKQRKHIVCTSQVFGRIAKPVREQFSEVVICKNYMHTFQFNKLLNRDDLTEDTSSDTNITGTVTKRFFWIHNPLMYKKYDTYSVIEKNKFVAQEERKGDIYAVDNRLSSNS